MPDSSQAGSPPLHTGADCTIVVPCYNEAQRLKPERFIDFIESGQRIHFLFVNDGSTDATPAILENLHQRCPEWIEWLDVQPNGGKAEAVRAGMLQVIHRAPTRFVGFWDGDLATPLDAIPHLLNKLRMTPGLEMVFGARVRLLGRAVHRRASRHYLGRCFATVASIVLRLPIYDTQCGAKVFRVTPALTQVLADRFLTSWVFDVEILARFVAHHRGNPRVLREIIFEYPLHQWEDVAGSRVKPIDFVKAIGELARIHRTYLR